MMRASDYIVEFFNKNGIDTVFTITGGFSMHLNDSFGLNTNYNIYYQHHEQSCGYSAVGYSKSNSNPCIVCTTAGCAATNTITPCLVAHQDSVPVLFISGQVKINESIRTINTEKMKLRHYSGADSDIISMVKPITKYSHEITSTSEIKEVLIETMENLLNGRPGPVWLSIPLDIQSMSIEETDIPVIKKTIHHHSEMNELPNNGINEIHNLLKQAKRPLIIAGNGIKLGHCNEKFKQFLKEYNIPTVVSYHGTDIIETMHPLYFGKVGLIGDRMGNFTLQNCDLLISFGCRMAQGVVGYRNDWFAREAKIVYIDNDPNELEKDNLKYTLKLNMDLNLFFDNYRYPGYVYDEWIEKCSHWKEKWLFELPPRTSDIINPYHALNCFFDKAPGNKSIIVSSGSIVTNVWHMVNVKEKDKFIISSQGDMGFELTASIGCCIAEKDKMIIPILGEGSFQLNIQELQTIVHYNLPIKIFVFNNGSYGANKITQTNFFKKEFGVDKDSGLSFPDTEKIANAYGIHYIGIKKYEDMETYLDEFIQYTGPIICEVFCCVQPRYPKLSAIKNEDGTFKNRPFEDMEPFMSRKKFEKEMIVDIV